LTEREALATVEKSHVLEIEGLNSVIANLKRDAEMAANGDSVAAEQQLLVDRLRSSEQALNQKIAGLQQDLSSKDKEILQLQKELHDGAEREKTTLDTVNSLRTRLAAAETNVTATASKDNTADSNHSSGSDEQVSELESQLEMLTMDKEQLLLEKEALEERLLTVEGEMLEQQQKYEEELMELQDKVEQHASALTSPMATGGGEDNPLQAIRCVLFVDVLFCRRRWLQRC